MGLIEASKIAKTYTDMAEPLEVLKGVDLKIEKGEVVGIFGASGSGKSTLLHILGGLDFPTHGEVSVDGLNLGSLDGDRLADFRNRSVGFVFQFYHLLPEFTAVENVMIPALISGLSKAKARGMARQALDAMGMSERMDHRPAMLSGGEQQRVALARAAVMKPPLVLADEPTGNLDRETGDLVWNYLVGLNRDYGIAMVVVSHNKELMDTLSVSYELRDGLLHRATAR